MIAMICSGKIKKNRSNEMRMEERSGGVVE